MAACRISTARGIRRGADESGGDQFAGPPSWLGIWLADDYTRGRGILGLSSGRVPTARWGSASIGRSLERRRRTITIDDGTQRIDHNRAIHTITFTIGALPRTGATAAFGALPPILRHRPQDLPAGVNPQAGSADSRCEAPGSGPRLGQRLSQSSPHRSTVNRSPGWQSSASQIATRVVNRMALARSFFNTLRLTRLTSTRHGQFRQRHAPRQQKLIEVAGHTRHGSHQPLPCPRQGAPRAKAAANVNAINANAGGM